MNNTITYPIISAKFKQNPSDFIVREIINIDFTNKGEHLWIYIKKINLNTVFVAKLLAKWANISLADVGYSGLKDRHGETYQWFSLRIPKQQLPVISFDQYIINQNLNSDESIFILDLVWHNKKLNRGTHKYNDFCLYLKNIIGKKSQINHRLQQIKNQGVPNYFGKQRFGNNGKNIENTYLFFRKILTSDKPYKPHKKDFEKHSIYISTAKSMIFNAILEKREKLNCWQTPVQGDVFNLHGSHSIFTADIDDVINQRLQEHDIYIASILFGSGDRKSSQLARQIEDDIINSPQFNELAQGLVKINSRLAWRSLCLLPQNLDWIWQDDTTLMLSFRLQTGSFATSILSACCKNLIENQIH